MKPRGIYMHTLRNIFEHKRKLNLMFNNSNMSTFGAKMIICVALVEINTQTHKMFRNMYYCVFFVCGGAFGDQR